ncbi:TetR/AcrR family transcriptional regulator [Nocardia transvalensis]|uniref:TetR/AcrR family transcriptional regulator n=1 Tax=Nocardia transvalensis TaxID=37333 RepID=UPI0018942BD5|nr:TetR/AcrR family transcriptional regulator [Nocardia transvalensis]MBF6329556.1 TetR family transcriptional regulator [Nocardia transvalensis]
MTGLKALADAALRLFLERGYGAVSLKEIAEAADVSVPTLFAHFPDGKVSLVFDMDAEREQALVAAVRDRAPGTTALQGLRDAYLNGPRVTDTAQMPEFMRLIEETPALSSYFRHMWERHEGALARAIAEDAGLAPGPNSPASSIYSNTVGAHC